MTSDRFDLVGAARGTILVIDNLSKADSGTYFCENGDIVSIPFTLILVRKNDDI